MSYYLLLWCQRTLCTQLWTLSWCLRTICSQQFTLSTQCRRVCKGQEFPNQHFLHNTQICMKIAVFEWKVILKRSLALNAKLTSLFLKRGGVTICKKFSFLFAGEYLMLFYGMIMRWLDEKNMNFLLYVRPMGWMSVFNYQLLRNYWNLVKSKVKRRYTCYPYRNKSYKNQNLTSASY